MFCDVLLVLLFPLFSLFLLFLLFSSVSSVSLSSPFVSPVIFIGISGHISGMKRATGDLLVSKRLDPLGRFSYLRVSRGLSARRVRRTKFGPERPPTRSGPRLLLLKRVFVFFLTPFVSHNVRESACSGSCLLLYVYCWHIITKLDAREGLYFKLFR